MSGLITSVRLATVTVAVACGVAPALRAAGRLPSTVPVPVVAAAVTVKVAEREPAGMVTEVGMVNTPTPPLLTSVTTASALSATGIEAVMVPVWLGARVSGLGERVRVRSVTASVSLSCGPASALRLAGSVASTMALPVLPGVTLKLAVVLPAGMVTLPGKVAVPVLAPSRARVTVVSALRACGMVTVICCVVPL